MRLIIDTDPGADDAIALLWALANDLVYRAELLAITTTEGNLKRRACFDNTSRLLKFCLRDDIPIARGAPHPGDNALHIHGSDGLAGMSGMLPDPTRRFDDAAEAPQQIVRLVTREPGELTIIAIGPLTNLAAAEKLQPGILAETRQIVVLGGSFSRGNVTPHAEFNAHYNPVAFHEVINSGASVVLIPLDITRQFELTPAHLVAAGLTRQHERITRFFTRLCASMCTTMARHKNESLFFVHDACALAYALYPQLFEAVEAHVNIEVRGDQKLFGRTTIAPAGAPNVTVLRKIDTVAVRDVMLQDILRFSTRIA